MNLDSGPGPPSYWARSPSLMFRTSLSRMTGKAWTSVLRLKDSGLGGFDAGPIVDVAVEIVLAQVASVLGLPARVVLGLAGGRRFVHGLQAFDPDAREPLRSEARVAEHVVEPVPDDDVRTGQPPVLQPVDDGRDALGPGADESRPDR